MEVSGRLTLLQPHPCLGSVGFPRASGPWPVPLSLWNPTRRARCPHLSAPPACPSVLRHGPYTSLPCPTGAERPGLSRTRSTCTGPGTRLPAALPGRSAVSPSAHSPLKLAAVALGKVTEWAGRTRKAGCPVAGLLHSQEATVPEGKSPGRGAVRGAGWKHRKGLGVGPRG